MSSKRRYREEPCPLMTADGGCELGDEWCGPGDRDCDERFQWELDQGWHDEGYGEMDFEEEVMKDAT